ncbi:hypothetical protein SNOG_14775 [Parastagonospora nodorum SN15]|uniref:Uncharacterized protein n=1 Tax=Phaeosphaeria nodorum (strain SN15 / ATCC MYA-4574 / FGSC 10173) TaxID=321614 RepID=Q0U0R0_PHANO|nr:hypothetical protein SNOG_14775 [Parastagonospora nodorum SN15]EAT77967.1 hypothetical protein SNOG_14775 [Parastagonospora nodorum SN15]
MSLCKRMVFASCVNDEFRDDMNSSEFKAFRVVLVLMTLCRALITLEVLSGISLIRGPVLLLFIVEGLPLASPVKEPQVPG